MRVARWAWVALAALSVTYAVTVFAVLVVGPAPFFQDSLYILSGLGPLGVGVLLVAHRPGNTVGKLLVLIGSLWVVGEGARIHLWSSQYVDSLPGTDLAAWLLSWVFVPGWLLIPVVLAVFPSGRVATAWLRWPIRIGLTVVMVMAAGAMVTSVSLDSYGDYLAGMVNPWVIEGLPAMDDVLGEVEHVASIMFALVAVLVVVDLVVRWRRSDGEERLQMRWFGLGALSLVALLLMGTALARFGPRLFEQQAATLAEIATVVLAINAVPVAIGVAVGRYRLYEIDRLLSRTFSYAVVVGTLVGVFAGMVLVLSNLMPMEGDVALAAATLAVAALFNPLRTRVQQRVDRRFNRSRYDAEREIVRFAARLRAELDPDALNAELVEVTARTMQPTTASVWIREA